MGKKKKPDPRQMPLLYDRPPQSVLDLRSVSWRVTSLSRVRWRQVRELAVAILYCGVIDGCRASVNRLTEVANANMDFPVIKSRRTFFRVRDRGKSIGVLVDEPAYNGAGRTFSERRVSLDRVRELVIATREAASARLKERRLSQIDKSGTHLALTWHSPSSLLKPVKPTKPILVDRRKCDDQVEQFPGEVADPAVIRGMAARIERQIGRCRDPRDWDLAVKASILSLSLGERWLQDAINGVVLAKPKPKRPWAYLHRCLDESCGSLGIAFNRELARVSVPLALLTYQPPERFERSCVAEPL
jgi:hypothetical protein